LAAELGVAGLGIAELGAVELKSAVVKMVVVKMVVVKMVAVKLAEAKMVVLMRSAERLRRAEVREQWAVLAQRLIERDDRNVRKRCRKGARRSWYRIPPWGDP
jgi:hypothetical protein